MTDLFFNDLVSKAILAGLELSLTMGPALMAIRYAFLGVSTGLLAAIYFNTPSGATIVATSLFFFLRSLLSLSHGDAQTF